MLFNCCLNTSFAFLVSVHPLGTKGVHVGVEVHLFFFAPPQSFLLSRVLCWCCVGCCVVLVSPTAVEGSLVLECVGVVNEIATKSIRARKGGSACME